MSKNQKECSFDNDYENFKDSKKEINMVIRYCYIQGPTGPQGEIGPQWIQGEKGEAGPPGPKGENGPTTIDVGITETWNFGTEAVVTNAGTNKDVILNFKIPGGEPGEKGEKGEIGLQGPRGFPGEIGISQVITIDGTETIEPNELAEVQDDFENNVHHLTFYIPKGEAGLQGPRGNKAFLVLRGDPNGVGAYGERYSNSNQRISIKDNTETIIPFEETGPAIFIEYDTNYAIEIREFGMYQINYFLSIATSTDTNYVVSIKATGTKLPGSDIKVEGKANSISKVNGSVIFGLTEDDEITFVITSEQDTDLIFDGTTNAKLSVIKLD